MTTHPAITNGFYELETDGDGLNVDLAPELVYAAKTMEVWPDSDDEHEHWYVRCSGCGCVIYGESVYGDKNLPARIRDLTANHGYRMDGHRYDNQNRRIEP